jgi:hypothetical protein
MGRASSTGPMPHARAVSEIAVYRGLSDGTPVSTANRSDDTPKRFATLFMVREDLIKVRPVWFDASH